MSLAVKNLDYEIGNERILDQISLEIKEGEFVGLVGPNGCGKSTLLKHIYRTYKPKGQTVFLDGKDIMDLSAKNWRENWRSWRRKISWNLILPFVIWLCSDVTPTRNFWREIRQRTGSFVKNAFGK